MMTADPLVLIADDNEYDTLLMRTVFERIGLALPLQFVRDGVEAIAYLRGEGVYGDRQQFPRPTVLLLDLNMPRKNGFEVLAWIREQPALTRPHVYVLSASSQPADIRRSYDLGAGAYLVKPGTLDELLHLAQTLVTWLRVIHHPPVA